MPAVFANVVEWLTRSTSAATREHARFERLLKETAEEMARRSDQATLQLGRSLVKIEDATEQFQKSVLERLLGELTAIHTELDRLRAGRPGAMDTADCRQWADGVIIVADRLDCTLERWGLARIATEGAAYDVKLHQTMERRFLPGLPPDRVIQEVAPGYYFRQDGRVLERARVIVSSSSQVTEENT